MQRKLFWVPILILGFALGPVGCSTSKRSDAGAIPPQDATHAKLELNHGRKWVVDSPMMEHIRHLERAVEDFEKTSGKGHTALAAEIQEDLGRLVTKCSMEGKAHDELHKWRMPLLGLSADYSKTTELQAQTEKLKEIKQALALFNVYFE